MKKLIFVLILLFSIDIIHRLLLLLPFTWFKSEVKDTVVEPVVIVEKKQITGFKSEVKDTVVEPVVQDDLLDKSKESILKWLQDVRATFEVEKRQMGILFYRRNYRGSMNGKWGWYKEGDERVNDKYVGEIKNGKPNGQGTHTLPDGGKYVGEWKDGEYHGQGTRTYGKGEWEGDKYEGEWKNRKRDGHGTYTWSDGGKYVGEWKSGKKHGQGTHTRSVGSKYVGKFKNGNFWNGIEYDKNGNINGKWVNSEVKDTVVEPVVPVEKRQIGVLFYRKVNGKWGWHEYGNEDYHEKFVGEIENGKPNGQGTETFPDGDKYVGEFKDGSLNGQGTYTFHDGGKYEGGWKDSKKHGQGTHTYGKGKWEGDKYIGEYRDGKRHGQGIYTYGKGKWNGDKYEGEYKDGKFHGQGTYTSSNGNKYVGGWKDGMRHGLGKGEWGEDKYEGIWKDDKKHGRGTFTWSSGDEALGEWRDGNPWNVDYFDNKGKFLGRFLDGVKDVEKKKEGVLFGRIVNGNPEWYKDGYNNDERYVGEIENEKPNGQGTLTLPDGRKFVGKFKDGKIDGQGTFTFPDRTKGVGYFRGTKPWNVTKYDKEGTILGKYVNGKWIKN